MKYVMFTHKTHGLRQPLLTTDHASHSDLKFGPGWVPTSAGFFSCKTLKTYGESSSLKLKPEPDDVQIIQMALADMGAMDHLVQDVNRNLNKLEALQAEQAGTTLTKDKKLTAG